MRRNESHEELQIGLTTEDERLDTMDNRSRDRRGDRRNNRRVDGRRDRVLGYIYLIQLSLLTCSKEFSPLDDI